MFYRDPTAEDNGILDGIIDLSVAKSIEECDVARNYGFMILVGDRVEYSLTERIMCIHLNRMICK